jgi:hypothetical protein
MVPPRPVADAAEVARLLIFWTRPAHLTRQEAETWATAEVRRLLAVTGGGPARLERLQDAAASCPRPCDWLLELTLADGEDAHRRLDSAPWRDWLGDLRLLGMRPATVLIDECDGVDVEVRS